MSLPPFPRVTRWRFSCWQYLRFSNRACCGLSKDGAAWTGAVDEDFSSICTKRRNVGTAKRALYRTMCGSKARRICFESRTAPDDRTPQPRAMQAPKTIGADWQQARFLKRKNHHRPPIERVTRGASAGVVDIHAPRQNSTLSNGLKGGF